MQIQMLNRTDGERVKVTFRNIDGSGSITTGMGVSWPEAGASMDGVGAVKYAGGNVFGFIGVSEKDIAINDYGLATAWGIADSVHISNVGSSITVTRGDILRPGAVAGTFFSSQTPAAMSTLLYRWVQAATTPVAVSTLAQTYCKGLVRAL